MRDWIQSSTYSYLSVLYGETFVCQKKKKKRNRKENEILSSVYMKNKYKKQNKKKTTKTLFCDAH